MQTYKYKAVTNTGGTVTGVLSGENREEIIKNLRSKNQYPVLVEAIQKSRDLDLGRFTRIKIKDIALFCRQLYTMLNAGVTLINCLDILKMQTENKKLQSIISILHQDVQKGMTFSQALRESNAFPELLINMAMAGEVSGNLDTILRRLAVHFEKENSIRNKIKSALVYPAFIGVITILVVIFLLIFVLPTFISMFTSSGVEVPALTRGLISTSEFIRKFWYIVIGIIIGVSYFIAKLVRTENGKLAIDTALMRIPVVKGTIQKMYTSRFTRTLSTLMASGIPLIQALESVAKVVNNKPVEQALLGAIDDVRRGINLSIPIKNTNLFPPMVYYMISIGEESGSIDDLLERTALFYDEELDEAIKKMMGLIEPTMIVFMAVFVGLIVVSIALPMFDMFKTVQ
ncbi:MAG TPA: type II secretion system F family protein [Patescibacteria group bacterium]|nr:type II secretion system F family protein [Patescibacteria group bacterium]